MIISLVSTIEYLSEWTVYCRSTAFWLDLSRVISRRTWSGGPGGSPKRRTRTRWTSRRSRRRRRRPGRRGCGSLGGGGSGSWGRGLRRAPPLRPLRRYQKLIREKSHPERRIIELGGPTTPSTPPRLTDLYGNIVGPWHRLPLLRRRERQREALVHIVDSCRLLVRIWLWFGTWVSWDLFIFFSMRVTMELW